MERRAINGESAAAMLLAEYYRFDKEDPAEALKWLRLASSSGQPEYLFSLASWLSEGEPERAELVEARQVAEIAASQGHAASAILAGDLWLLGEPDLVLAKRAYLNAFRLGRLEALLRLSDMFRLVVDPSTREIIDACSWLQAYLEIGAPNSFMEERKSKELVDLLGRLPNEARSQIQSRVEQLRGDWMKVGSNRARD